MVEFGPDSDECKAVILAHNLCLRASGFNVKI
jgi:hypothetical protein